MLSVEAWFIILGVCCLAMIDMVETRLSIRNQSIEIEKLQNEVKDYKSTIRDQEDDLRQAFIRIEDLSSIIDSNKKYGPTFWNRIIPLPKSLDRDEKTQGAFDNQDESSSAFSDRNSPTLTLLNRDQSTSTNPNQDKKTEEGG